MCEFLKGPNNNDVKKISELTISLNMEKHVCDALFCVISDLKANPSSEKISKVNELYSKLLLARSSKDFSDIEDISHEIIGIDRCK